MKCEAKVVAPLNSKKTGTPPSSTRLHDWMKTTWGQLGASKTRAAKSCIELLLFISQLILTNMQSYRHFPLLTMDKKETVKKSESWVIFFTISCVFYCVGDWDGPTWQPPWWLQNTVCRYRSSLFRVQWFALRRLLYTSVSVPYAALYVSFSLQRDILHFLKISL